MSDADIVPDRIGSNAHDDDDGDDDDDDDDDCMCG